MSAPPVRIESMAWTDHRYAALATYLGWAFPNLALIQMATIWRWQTEHYTDERPTYAVPEAVIVGALGIEGPVAAVRAELAELQTDGLYRIRGGRDSKGKSRIDWLYRDRQAQAERGRRRAARAHDEGRAGGRFTSGPPAGHQPAGVHPPAVGQPITSSLVSGLRSDQNSLSGEPGPDQPSTVRTTHPEATAPGEAIGPLLEHAVDAINAARRSIDPDSEPIHPMEIHTPAGAGLRDRLRAVVPPTDRRRKLDHAISVLAARATAAGVVDDLRLGYLGGEKSWPQLLAGSVKGAARSGAGPPRGRPAPRGQHTPDTSTPFPDGEQPI